MHNEGGLKTMPVKKRQEILGEKLRTTKVEKLIKFYGEQAKSM